MPSKHEDFWLASSFAVVGDSSSKRPFPALTYKGLKNLGKVVHAIDPGAEEIQGDPCFKSFEALPAPAEVAVIEVTPELTPKWIEAAAGAGIKKIWLHMKTDTPEAYAKAEELGVELLTGTCAVMYVTPGLSPHAIHRVINKLLKKY